MFVEANLNDRIKVKLNRYGLEIWKKDFETYNFIRSETFETVRKRYTDEQGLTEFHMWEFMRLFGPHFSIGFQNHPIEDMNVLIDIVLSEKIN